MYNPTPKIYSHVSSMPLKQVHNSISSLEKTLRFLQSNHTNISDGILSDSIKVRPLEYPVIMDVNLTTLTSEKRLAFKVTVCVLCCLSLCGNISTLGVNLKRKMRPFFRACLISLAISDLLNTIFSTMVYVAQLSTEYVQIWILGKVMCSLVPFTTTTAISASSMTLVLIALDRYLAVMKSFITKWKPGHISGVICMLIIWIVAIGISSPIFWIYHTNTVYIRTEVNIDSGEQISWQVDTLMENRSYNFVQSEKLVMMCVSDQKDVTLYYIIVFGIIFAPCIIAFVWLNANIAKKIWIRRHKISKQTVFENNERSTATIPAKSINSQKILKEIDGMGFSKSTKISTIMTDNAGNSTTKPYNISNTREARHLRMVIVLILLIAVFLCLRLPAWIFLLMRMYGNYSKKHDWIVFFIFGILNLTSCVLNPLFYTFLHETIQYILCCKMRCKMRRRRLQRCIIDECYCENSSMSTDDSVLNFSCCACCGIFCGIFGICSRANISKCNNNSNAKERNINEQKKSKTRAVSLERDEGVDCSDNSFDEDEGDDYNHNEDDNENLSVHCNQQIFTVFSVVSLVPVSTDLSVKTNAF